MNQWMEDGWLNGCNGRMGMCMDGGRDRVLNDLMARVLNGGWLVKWKNGYVHGWREG